MTDPISKSTATNRWVQAGIFLVIAILLVVKFSDAWSKNRNAGFPNKPIQIVVPYLAGGGTDTFARIVQKSLVEKDTLGVPVVIVNQPGGSATIGSRLVKNSPPDGYRVLCHHEGIIATKLAELVPYGPEAFRPVAQTGAIVLLMVVRADSPYRSLTDLLEAAQKDPNSIRIGANNGSPAYFICKQLLGEYPGADFNFITADGSKRHLYLLGGKLEAGIFSLAEYVSFRESDDAADSENILAIGNFGSTRHPSIPDVATSKEQGLKTSASNAYYVWAPKETPDGVVDVLADALEDSMTSTTVVDQLNAMSLDPKFRRGDELKDHLDSRVAAFEKLAVKADSSVPDFSKWAIGIVAALFVLVVAQSYLQPNQDHQLPGVKELPALNAMVLICVGILVAYIVALHFEVPFVFATTPAVFLIGMTIAKWNQGWVVSMIQLALLFSLLVEFIFTRIFTVALP